MNRTGRSGRANGPRRLPRAVLAVAVGFCLLAGPGEARGQAREWWDTYEAAVKIISADGSSEEALTGARSNLLRVIRSQDTEGNLATYNPSVRIDYLPYFYLGWAEIKLGRYYEAEKRFQKSRQIGFITKGVPRNVKARFEQLSGLVDALKPAAASLERARENSNVKDCLASSGIQAGPSLRTAMQTLEGLLASPTDSGGLGAAVKSLDAAVAACVREVAGARMARLSGDYRAARDAVNVSGISDLLPASTSKQLQAAVAAGDSAESSGDAGGIQDATKSLNGLLARVTRALDSEMAGLVKQAGSVASGNEASLNGRGQLGSRLKASASRARSRKASGKSGAELAAVVAAGVELKGLVEEAGKALQPLLQASRSSLDSARRSYESWARQKACEVGAVDSASTVRQAGTAADQALKGSSTDEMSSAEAQLSSVREAVEKQIAGALPRVRQQANGIIGSADSVIANVTSSGDQARGRQLKQEVEQATGGGDICAIEKATASLRGWVGTVAPALEKGRREAIARNAPHQEDAQAILDGFGGILDGATVTALQGPAQELTDLLKNSYDPGAIDTAGDAVKALVVRAGGEVKGRMEEGIGSLSTLMKDAGWTEVSQGRRTWLEGNLPAVRRAVDRMEKPGLLARFAREYPRARVEMALASAFDSLYGRRDADAAARTLEDLGPGIRAGSAALNYALSYVYWWQARASVDGAAEGLMQKARAAFSAGRDLRMDPASLAGSLFAPAFVTEMSGL